MPLKTEIDRDPSLKKSAYFLEKVNPAGAVPAIEWGGVGGVPIVESDVCVHFLEDAFPDQGTKLKPSDPILAACANRANKLFDPTPFYKFLSNQDPEKDKFFVESIEEMLSKWVAIHQTTTGPYICGDVFSHADILSCTHIERFRFTLRHFRGYDCLHAGEEPWRLRLLVWFSACASRPSMQRTSCTAEFYNVIFSGHAGARGISTLQSH